MKERLVVSSELESLSQVYAWLEIFLAKEVSSKKLRDILLIVQEMVTNSILHGNANDVEKSVSIEVEVQPTLIEINIEDEGRGISKLPSKKEAEELDYLAENGRGLKLAVLMTERIELHGNRIKLLFNKGTK